MLSGSGRRRDERREAEEAGQEREDDELKLAAKTKMTGEAAVKQKSGKGRTRGRRDERTDEGDEGTDEGTDEGDEGTDEGDKRRGKRRRRLFCTAEGVHDDDGEDDGGNGGVEPIALFHEIEQRKGHAHDGGENENEHAGLYPPDGGEV